MQYLTAAFNECVHSSVKGSKYMLDILYSGHYFLNLKKSQYIIIAFN